MLRVIPQVSRRTSEASTCRHHCRPILIRWRGFAVDGSALPESLKRIDQVMVFPNEYPGQIYKFNWCLHRDGIVNMKKAAFRITKPLDLKVAGLVPLEEPLTTEAVAEDEVPEAGSAELSFETYDNVTRRTKDLLSMSSKIYCPEGYLPGTRMPIRIITNSATLAPQCVAYLERAPRRDPLPLQITGFVLEATEDEFKAFAIEEDEVKGRDGKKVPRVIGSVVMVGQNPNINVLIAGLKACYKVVSVDEVERETVRAGRGNT